MTHQDVPILRPRGLEFVNTQPPVAPTGDPLEVLREALAAITVHIVVHPDDLERVQTAAADLAGPPVVVTGSVACPPGRLLVLRPVSPSLTAHRIDRQEPSA